MEELLYPEEVSKMLGVKESTIKKWLRNGDLPGIKTGKAWRIKKSDAQELINKGLVLDKAPKVQINEETIEKIIAKELDGEIVSDKTIKLFTFSTLEAIRNKNVTVSEVEEIVSRIINRMRAEGLL